MDLTEQERKVNESAYESQKAELEAEHMGEYIAIRRGEIFLGKTNQEALAKAREKYPDAEVNHGILQKIGQKPLEWRLHTPQFKH